MTNKYASLSYLDAARLLYSKVQCTPEGMVHEVQRDPERMNDIIALAEHLKTSAGGGFYTVDTPHGTRSFRTSLNDDEKGALA